ncbi:MAG TPA: 3-isopropylmalate dehydrogenase [Desulfurobacteriaceae bacterium]|nr:3-isopropylmalate dehydrogenase [Desulfurobacteriaceae bacterium]
MKIAVLPGDGIGKEIIPQAIKVINAIKEKYSLDIEIEYGDIGGEAIDKYGTPFPESTKKLVLEADATLLGAVGGPKWDNLPFEKRPERGLLALRKVLKTFANLRPAKVYDELVSASTLKEDIVKGVDILVIRELTSGIYFGKPRGVFEIENFPLREYYSEDELKGNKVGINTLKYTDEEITRIAKVAFEAARKRNKKVTSVDKANVLEATSFWREVVEQVSKDYPDVELNHMYVDNAAMQLLRWPKQFDVILTTNMFGDIISDEAAALTGSLGMLPSASLGGEKGLYEPVHGSAPDIAGKDLANPIATINSVGMMFNYTFNRPDIEALIDKAVREVLKEYRTKDIYSPGTKLVSCSQMGDLISRRILDLN